MGWILVEQEMVHYSFIIVTLVCFQWLIIVITQRVQRSAAFCKRTHIYLIEVKVIINTNFQDTGQKDAIVQHKQTTIAAKDIVTYKDLSHSDLRT